MMPPTQAAILEARDQIALAIMILGHDSPEATFEAGAVQALNWVLGNPGSEKFAEHLHYISTLQARMVPHG